MGEIVTLESVLRSDTLPTLPAVAAKVLAATEGEETDIFAIADILAQDTSLSARILKVVNSPIYGLWTPVATIRKAVSVLGILPVRSLVLSFSLLGMRGEAGDVFDYPAFWEKSLTMAVASRRMMKDLGLPEADEGFTAGLLANVGEMILARACPGHYSWVLQGKKSDRPLNVIEHEILGFDHSKVGVEVARRWRLPESLEAAIGHHHAPEEYSGSDADLHRLVRIVYLSEILADIFYSKNPQGSKDHFIERSRQLLNLDERDFPRLAETVRSEVNAAADFFGIHVALQHSVEEILQEANLRLGQVTLSYEQAKQDLLRSQMELVQLNRALQGGRGNLHGMSEIDEVTGAYNHRYLQTFLEVATIRSLRYGYPLTLILIGIDEVKGGGSSPEEKMNGVLTELYRILRAAARPSDVIARYAEGEMALVLTDTSVEEGVGVAERVRDGVVRHPFSDGTVDLAVAVSLSVASRGPHEYRSADLIQRASRALQQARKGETKNVVSVAETN